MHEVKVHADPRTYDPRNIFGAFTRRGAICGAAVIAIVSLAVWAVAARGVNETLAWALALPASVAVGVMALWDTHGLKTERSVPLIVREQRSSRLMTWAPPVLRIERAAATETRRERRARTRAERAEGRERARETEVGGPSVADLIEGGGDGRA